MNDVCSILRLQLRCSLVVLCARFLTTPYHPVSLGLSQLEVLGNGSGRPAIRTHGWVVATEDGEMWRA
ncbi:hypothetical protein BGZ63DRAFT_235745 [Mariannaea sp. PMI_226]|nr:hypothetical protein BGZ63DRAFT_235745 [Mariannaea sp. PMI_226]